MIRPPIVLSAVGRRTIVKDMYRANYYIGLVISEKKVSSWIIALLLMALRHSYQKYLLVGQWGTDDHRLSVGLRLARREGRREGSLRDLF
jgi:hypothetical protein